MRGKKTDAFCRLALLSSCLGEQEEVTSFARYAIRKCQGALLRVLGTPQCGVGWLFKAGRVFEGALR